MKNICLIILLFIAKPASQAYSRHLIHSVHAGIMYSHPSRGMHTIHVLPKRSEQSGILAYLSAGCAVLGLAIASPGMSLFLILLGTAAGVFGKIGLKAYRGRTFLRVLCVVGIILGAVVLLLGMVPLIFLTL